ncbi:hypothetical protein JM654_23465 [Microbacterium oxydans]|nr:hypothetical protein [Microbacterium oxydans]
MRESLVDSPLLIVVCAHGITPKPVRLNPADLGLAGGLALAVPTVFVTRPKPGPSVPSADMSVLDGTADVDPAHIGGF